MASEEEYLHETIRALGLGPLAHQAYIDLLQPSARQDLGQPNSCRKDNYNFFSAFGNDCLGYDRIEEWPIVKLTQS